MPGAADNLKVLVGAAARWCGGAVVTLLFWSVWIALAFLLVVEIYVARTSDMQLPLFVRRAIEQRMAASGVGLTFRDARFDPSGRILAQDIALTLPGFGDEPLITARGLYASINPWAMLVGRFEPEEVRVTGASLRIPALLSPSGRADEIVRDLDAEVRPRRKTFDVPYLTCRLGTMQVALSGAVDLGGIPSKGAVALPGTDFLARNYAAFSREGASILASLAGLDRPLLEARLIPSHSEIAQIDATLTAAGLHLAGGDIRKLRLSGRVPLWGKHDQPVEFRVELGDIELAAQGARARAVQAWVHTRLAATGAGIRSDQPIHARLVAAEISAAGLDLANPIVDARLEGWEAGHRRLRTEVRGRIWAQPVDARGDLDLDGRSGRIDFDGRIAPDGLSFVEGRIHRSLARWVVMNAPLTASVRADFGPGWKFMRVGGRFEGTDLMASQVHLDEIRARFDFDGRHLSAPEATVRFGDDFASGSFEEDVPSRDYRFLLEGGIRPLHISPWISGHWWPIFFSYFDVSAAPIRANFDMRGCWKTGSRSVVFVSVDSAKPVIRGVAFDRLRARLFIRPQFIDGLDLWGERQGMAVRGTFDRRIDYDSSAWLELNFDALSGFDLDSARKVMGPEVAPGVLEHFVLERPPRVSIQGHLEGSASSNGSHQAIHIESRSRGEFRFDDFPVEGASFTADIRDGDVTVTDVRAGFAGGRVTGSATSIRGKDDKRRLHFEAALRDASLGPAVATVTGFTDRRNHRNPPPPGEFMRDRANVQLDAALEADGSTEDAYSYHGAGKVALKGPGLGEIRMLGLLSALLRFTSLRFTSLQSNVVLDGSRLFFPDLRITGANSSINAKGTYALDSHTLDFRATVNPFKESKLLPQKFMDLVFTPFSDVLAIRLGGTVDKPNWSFVNGPASLLRGLSAPPGPLAAPPP